MIGRIINLKIEKIANLLLITLHVIPQLFTDPLRMIEIFPS